MRTRKTGVLVLALLLLATSIAPIALASGDASVEGGPVASVIDWVLDLLNLGEENPPPDEIGPEINPGG